MEAITVKNVKKTTHTRGYLPLTMLYFNRDCRSRPGEYSYASAPGQ